MCSAGSGWSLQAYVHASLPSSVARRIHEPGCRIATPAASPLLPIEVQPIARSRLSDAAHLRTFRAETSLSRGPFGAATPGFR
jgi:hypothetical protein